ncbi:hypothetical protein C8R44DRAFT_755771 [Mycena epipterygia]|nr:hypothetical protein C8R44DRAFT_755771 [Mycena epipterygia]
MAVNIALPPLRIWAEQHLSSIIKATTQTAFEAAFDGFLSKSATVTVNGKHVSRDEYKKQLQGEGFDEAGAEVTFSGAVEVPADNSIQLSPKELYPQGGVVGLFYTATISENIVIRDAPVQSQVTSSLNLVIEEDKSLTPPHFPGGIRGFLPDGRRVSVLNQIILDTHKN